MIAIINNKAYLKDIKNPEQSFDMFEFLKVHTNIRLYAIDGMNRYGCDMNGKLTKIENMPIEFVENGYCINPFYVEQSVVEPTTEPTNEATVSIVELSKEQDATDTSLFDSVIQCDDCNAIHAETETALKNAIGENERLLELYKEATVALENCIAERDMFIKIHEELKVEYNKEIDRANVAEEKLAIANADESKVDKTDVRGLCKALYDLGFDVDLGFYGDIE